MANDEEIMPYITSANIACGYHAGDETIMKRTVEAAMKYNVSIGAHPSFPDKENFGRTEMDLDENVLYDIIVLQIKVLDTIAEMCGATLHHVKPHGALYNISAKDAIVASTIARAVKDTDPNLILYGMSGSHSIIEAKKLSLRTVSEVFADRTYQRNGALTPRTESNCMIENEAKAIKQVLQMMHEGKVTTTARRKIQVQPETICIHGDGPNALLFAKSINHTLKMQGYNVNAPSLY